ncbi:unnamed protein product, partial [Prorocentrum cordatum]
REEPLEVLVPLSDCIAAAVGASPPSGRPSPCTPCPACPEAGESSTPSWTLQIGTGLLGLLFVESAKLVLALARRLGSALRQVAGGVGPRPRVALGDRARTSPEPERGLAEAVDFHALALEQARASQLKSSLSQWWLDLFTWSDTAHLDPSSGSWARAVLQLALEELTCIGFGVFRVLLRLGLRSGAESRLVFRGQLATPSTLSSLLGTLSGWRPAPAPSSTRAHLPRPPRPWPLAAPQCWTGESAPWSLPLAALLPRPPVGLGAGARPAAAPAVPGALAVPPPAAAAAAAPAAAPEAPVMAQPVLAPAPGPPAAGAGAAPPDPRVLAASFDMLGQRHIEFREGVLRLVEHPLPDWRLSGP